MGFLKNKQKQLEKDITAEFLELLCRSARRYVEDGHNYPQWITFMTVKIRPLIDNIEKMYPTLARTHILKLKGEIENGSI
jgi:hypothetical protein